MITKGRSCARSGRVREKGRGSRGKAGQEAKESKGWGLSGGKNGKRKKNPLCLQPARQKKAINTRHLSRWRRNTEKKKEKTQKGRMRKGEKR